MKNHGVKRISKYPLWLRLKKHYCPQCGAVLEAVKREKTVNSAAEEAKGFDFSLGDSFMSGDVKFIWTELKCTPCDKSYSLDEIKAAEK